ncbi:hypothetical protein [uncultured Ruminococcus sp.]|uniref:hypothetical protein n=1 Tax=uncultured Ruminococcus sp. TaxID=165186 RepID=UPI0025F9A019|nr:hypothetical protein [uncultured Ruminococcus sp.]
MKKIKMLSAALAAPCMTVSLASCAHSDELSGEYESESDTTCKLFFVHTFEKGRQRRD